MKDTFGSFQISQTRRRKIPSVYAEQLDGIDLPLYEGAGYTGNFDQLQEMAEFGAFFSYPRLDDVIRLTPLLQAYDGDLYETLGLAAARLYLGNPPIQLEFAGIQFRIGHIHQLHSV